MTWITAGNEECLVEALVVVRKPAKATEATVYRLGQGMGSCETGMPVETKTATKG